MWQPCPCHLAETGDCIICSQLQGCTGCDCVNWKGVCIYQEYIWNNKKSKSEREYYLSEIIKKVELDQQVVIMTISTSEYLANNLIYPGSFIFIRHPDCNQFYDVPMSIMDVDIVNSNITIAIELKGVKTKKINELEEGEKILVKGPFWNGVLGLNKVKQRKDSTCLTIARGIGQAPLVPVLKKLYNNNNKVITILDKGNYEENFINEYLIKYNCEVIHCNIFKNGQITNEFKQLLIDLLLKEDISLVHSSAADIINYNVMKLIEDVIDKINENETKNDSQKAKIDFTCCNNAKMCCGEGVCGCCTRKNNDHKLRRMCKMQTEPKYVLEGRRLF